MIFRFSRSVSCKIRKMVQGSNDLSTLPLKCENGIFFKITKERLVLSFWHNSSRYFLSCCDWSVCSINLGHDVFYLCFSSSARIDFCLWREKNKTKKFQRKFVPLDKFAGTSTVLNSRRERDRLLDANNSIMETDGEGKFVSFKVVLGGRFHYSSKWITVPIAWCVAFIGARKQLRDSSWWIQGQTSEEKSLKKFFCVIAVVGKTLILTEKKDLEVLPSLDHSLAHVCSPCQWVRAHCHGLERERKSNLEKVANEICSSGHPLLLFFRCTARRWPVKNELFFINGAVDGTSGERFLTITFRISSVKYCVYFLVVCLFFPRSRALIFKRNWTRNIKNKRHALIRWLRARVSLRWAGSTTYWVVQLSGASLSLATNDETSGYLLSGYSGH